MKWWGNQCHWPCKSCQNVPRPSAKFEQLLIGNISKCKDRLSISILASISQPYWEVRKLIFDFGLLYGPPHEKTCLLGITTKAKTSLRIHADWSLPLFFAFWNNQNFNFLASLCSWGDWFEYHFVGNPEDRFCRVDAHIEACVLSLPFFVYNFTKLTAIFGNLETSQCHVLLLQKTSGTTISGKQEIHLDQCLHYPHHPKTIQI